MEMPFDQLVQRAQSYTPYITHADPSSAPSIRNTHARLTYANNAPPPPDDKLRHQHLQVYLHGPGAKSSDHVMVLDRERAITAVKGKRDFVLLEPLDDAVDRKRRLVFVLLRDAGQRLEAAQVYLADSLSRWLSEEKTDGSGRPYGVSKDEDPILRKQFTKSQIFAIHSFARS